MSWAVRQPQDPCPGVYFLHYPKIANMMGFTPMVRSSHMALLTLRKGNYGGAPDLIRGVLKRYQALPGKRLEVGEGLDIGALVLALKVEGNTW